MPRPSHNQLARRERQIMEIVYRPLSDGRRWVTSDPDCHYPPWFWGCGLSAPSRC